jgi:hypothetical protein
MFPHSRQVQVRCPLTSAASTGALAVAAATGETVARCTLLFLTPTGAQERQIDDLTAAAAQVRDTVLASAPERAR